MSSEKQTLPCCQSQKSLQAISTSKESSSENPSIPASGNLQTSQIQPKKVVPTGPKTRITIHYDVGFPNALYIRGEGSELSWEKGLLLKNVKSDEWLWETTKPFTTCEFKILINDHEYEIGGNHLLSCGASVHYTPKFH